MPNSMDTLKNLLGDDAGDKIKNIMSSLSSNGSGESLPDKSLGEDSLEYLMQMKDIISKLTDTHDDPRSNLLVSLKPYMSDGRKKSIDSAVRLLNLTKLSQLFRQ